MLLFVKGNGDHRDLNVRHTLSLHDALPISKAVRCAELHTKVRGDRVEADRASGKPHGVIGELESLVAVHPMNEHLWSLLALALYRAGRQVDSLNAYHRARSALLDVGVEPGRELDELHQRVLRHDASLAGPVPPALRAIGGRPTQLPPEIAGRAHGPFVGREAALDRMTAAWEAMGSGSRLVLVTGEAGIGKTRVAAELARTLQSKGTRVLFGR